MDLRFPEKGFETSSVDINALNEKLKPFFSNHWDTFLKGQRKAFERNIQQSEALRGLIRQNEDIVLIFDVFGVDLKPKELENAVLNFKLREEEHKKNHQEVRIREEHNLVATEEEYALGVFREALETQVRDAVFELLRKGYMPTYSGFKDIAEGTQLIKIYGHGINIRKIRKGLPKYVDVNLFDDNISISFTPETRSISEIKKQWDEIVSLIPPNDSSKERIIRLNLSQRGFSQTPAAIEFRRFQDIIRKGENALLGDGLAFVDGKIVEESFFHESGI